MLRSALGSPHEFVITYELVPGQGCCGKKVERLLDLAREVKADGRISALSITDNPGGSAALAPAAIGAELLQLGIEPLIHFSLKDKNRSQIVSHLYLYQRLGLRSLLVMGGDFPKPGYYGQARPVFDLDSIQTLQLMRDMETGRHPGCALSIEAAAPPLQRLRGLALQGHRGRAGLAVRAAAAESGGRRGFHHQPARL
uniref:methylenetetrahydrofolate reductase n=1 Tax=Candidatus Electronema sp. TaxID=2698783 RepID=UPI004056CE78